MAGRARMLTRSLTQRRRRLISSARSSGSASILGRRRRSSGFPHVPLTKLVQKFLGRDEERILLQNAADDDHRMRAHNVDHRISSELIQAVGADHGIVVVTPDMIDAR